MLAVFKSFDWKNVFFEKCYFFEKVFKHMQLLTFEISIKELFRQKKFDFNKASFTSQMLYQFFSKNIIPLAKYLC